MSYPKIYDITKTDGDRGYGIYLGEYVRYATSAEYIYLVSVKEETEYRFIRIKNTKQNKSNKYSISEFEKYYLDIGGRCEID